MIIAIFCCYTNQGWIKWFLPQEQGFKMKISSIKFLTNNVQNMVISHKCTKLVQSCINLNVQRCSPLPSKFNFDFIFTPTQLLYNKILQIMNTFDNIIRHVKVPHTWHIVQYSYQHSIGLEKKQEKQNKNKKTKTKKDTLGLRYTEWYFQVILAHATYCLIKVNIFKLQYF